LTLPMGSNVAWPQSVVGSAIVAGLGVVRKSVVIS